LYTRIGAYGMTDDLAAQRSSGASNAPRVSVVIPAYNAEDYLERALNSALAQTMADLEVIVVDDASTDATLEVANRVAARDPRVRVVRNEHNAGSAASRNRALSVARGEWIALLDADDEWLPRRLERMLADGGEADVISDDVYIVRGSLVKPQEAVLWSLLQQQGLTATGRRRISTLDLVEYSLALLKPIIKRAFIERHGLSYEPTLRIAQDFHLYFEILAAGARWVQLPQGYYLYYKHAGAISKDKLQLWQNTIDSNRALLGHPAAVGDRTLTAALERRIQVAKGHVVFAKVRDSLRQRRFAELGRELRKNPSDLLLVARFVAERLFLRVLWRVRRLRARKATDGPGV
jgi:succinoglycan biosynthesis protein ExoO